jgi:phosphoribosylanthranilate isomerase
MTTRFKICCIASLAEMRLAVDAGASAVGLVSAMPSGPGVIAEETIQSVAHAVPPGVASFLLTSLTDADEIIAQHRRCGTGVIQLCDRLARGTHACLRAALAGIRLVQVVHVRGAGSLTEALEAAHDADALLLDSGRPDLAVKELGGTGRTHDWSVSRAIRDASPVPVYLAGGLTAENVADAVRAVRPFAVDVCGGVRTAGALDSAKLARFAVAIRSLDA